MDNNPLDMKGCLQNDWKISPRTTWFETDALEPKDLPISVRKYFNFIVGYYLPDVLPEDEVNDSNIEDFDAPVKTRIYRGKGQYQDMYCLSTQDCGEFVGGDFYIRVDGTFARDYMNV